ncbi:MAG: heme-binding protein [Chloroflexi bacterium]|nr:heme-binding protein [Chloroflexota bacterium]
MSLTAANAAQMIQASQDKARETGVAVCTAIVDADGRLFAFARMEGVHWLSIEVAQAKAFTGALLRRDGADLQNMNPAVLSALSVMYGGKLLAMGSVTPVRQDGVVIASVGCSGATDEQDGECARAARDAYADG